MPIPVKDAATIAAKYVTRASAAGQDYTNGVQNAGAHWETNTKASEANYVAGLNSSFGRHAFLAGVTKAGAVKFTTNAVKLGAQRYPQGVQNAQGTYAAAMGPVLQRIASIDLPPRGPKRSPANQARANAVALSLGAWKEGK